MGCGFESSTGFEKKGLAESFGANGLSEKSSAILELSVGVEVRYGFLE